MLRAAKRTCILTFRLSQRFSPPGVRQRSAKEQKPARNNWPESVSSQVDHTRFISVAVRFNSISLAASVVPSPRREARHQHISANEVNTRSTVEPVGDHATRRGGRFRIRQAPLKVRAQGSSWPCNRTEARLRDQCPPPHVSVLSTQCHCLTDLRASRPCYRTAVCLPSSMGLYSERFHGLLTLSSECFSTFPHGTCSLSGLWKYLALDRVYDLLSAACQSNATLREKRPTPISFYTRPHGSYTLRGVSPSVSRDSQFVADLALA